MKKGMNWGCLLLTMLFILVPVRQTLSSSNVGDQDKSNMLAQMLLEIEVAARTAETEIEKLPSIVDAERSRIKNALDTWARNDLTKIVGKNYSDIEKALAATKLPLEEGTFSIWWKQTKAGAGSNEDLEKLVELFFSNLQPRLSSVSESFQREILDSLESETQFHLQSSMERIREPFLGILKQRLPVYNTIPIPNTERASLAFSSSGKKNGFSQGSIPLKGLVGIAFVVLGKRIINRIMKFLVMKIAGKVLSKIVPVVGWLLLAFEVYDMTGARDRLEEEMRKSFYEEYKLEFIAESLWWKSEDGSSLSMREEIDRNIASLLKNWEKICKSEAASMIQSAHILSFSQPVRDYVAKEIAKGSEFEPVLQKMGILWDAFGPLLAQGPIDVLESILISAPDRNDLRILSKVMGPRLLEIYKNYGIDFLQGVDRLGAQNFLTSEEWSNTEIDWHLLNGDLAYVPNLSENREAAIGLLALVKEKVPVKGLSPDSMAKIAPKKDLFRKLWGILKPDIEKTIQLLGNKKAVAGLEESLALFPGSAAVFIREYGTEFWTAWSRAEILDLLQITDLRAVNSGRPRDQSAVSPEDRAELINIYRRAGKPGIALWDIYATEESGEVGKNFARKSIECLADGYPFEDLKDMEHLEFAIFCRRIPFVGRFLYDNLKNLGMIPRFLVIFGAVLMSLSMIILFLRRK